MQYAGQAELSGLGLRFTTGGKSVTSDPQLPKLLAASGATLIGYRQLRDAMRAG